MGVIRYRTNEGYYERVEKFLKKKNWNVANPPCKHDMQTWHENRKLGREKRKACSDTINKKCVSRGWKCTEFKGLD